MRCVVSFDLVTVPSGAEIESATLRMYQGAIHSARDTATTRLAGLDTVLVDNISYDAFTTWQDLWGRCDHGHRHRHRAPCHLVLREHLAPDRRDHSAEDEFALYHNGRLQFRVYHHYRHNHDVTEDSDEWIMGDSPTHKPELVIVYR